MKTLTTILLSLIFLNVGKAQQGTYRIGKAGLIDTILIPFVFDTTEVIITYADTSSCEIESYNYKLERFYQRISDNKLYWVFGYETEGKLLDDRKEPIAPKYIILDYKPLKWNRE